MAGSAGKRRREESEDGSVSESAVSRGTRRSRRRRANEPPVDEMCDKLITAATDVLNEMGHGYSEAVYEKALVVEIQQTAIGVASQQVPITYYFKDHPVGRGQIDILVTHPSIGDRQIVLELKLEGTSAVRTINEAIDQIRGYLRNMPVESRGIVIVFPKPGKHRCLCVKVAQGATAPYVSASTLSSTYASF